jgi:hypothetical protein
MDNEHYSPVKPNFYNYISKGLEKNIDKLIRQFVINKLDIETIQICAYNVNNEGVYPFLQFLLVDDTYLTFPHIPLSWNEINTKQIIQLVTLLLFSLTLTDSLESFSEKLHVDGFCVFKDTLCIFIDLTDNKLNLNDIYLNSPCRFVLIDEIVNRKHMCNMKISYDVTDFFKYNYDYCVLTNENGDTYETPIVSYAGRPENMLNFTYVFGVSKKDKSAILGPYHYFTDFNGAIRESSYNDCLSIKLESDKRIKSGVVRFAVFTKNIKYIENLPNDPTDTSETKSQRLVDDKLDTFMERLTMRISDHDGKWSETYDSCYLGEIQLDNGIVMKNTNLLAVKEYIQQVPLSYHYVDKTFLGDKYDENREYKIM